MTAHPDILAALIALYRLVEGDRPTAEAVQAARAIIERESPEDA